MENIYEVADLNKRKSLIIISLFVIFVTLSIYVISKALAIYIGYQVGGLGFLGIALLVSGLTGFWGYYYSDKIILNISEAREAKKDKDFKFYTVVENLCLASGIPRPKLYVIEDSAMNAFATGRNPENASLCVTRGLLDKLNRTELEGVVGHELTHIRNYDTRLMSVVAVLVGTLALLADWFFRMSWYGRKNSEEKSKQGGEFLIIIAFLFAILSPLIAQLIQLAISRRREFMADAGSVELTRQPSGLISALKKISKDKEPLEAANKATAHLYIDNPFKFSSGRTLDWFSGLFNTHPPIEERIKNLERML